MIRPLDALGECAAATRRGVETTRADPHRRGVTVRGWEEKRNMAAKKKGGAKKAAGGELIISKSRTKAAAKKCNVGGEFYGALDKAVRKLIADAEERATGNKRKTLKAVDL
jgi:histone H3/H4